MSVEERTKTLAHYIITRCEPSRLGATRLNKVMWFADLEHYRRTGRTVSGQTSYEKRQFGPVPNGILPALDALRNERAIHWRHEPTPAGARREFVWLEPADITDFTADEIDVVNEALEWVCGRSARTVSDMTHDALWDEVDLGAQIHIGAASVTPGEVLPEDMEWALGALDGMEPEHAS